MTFIPVSFLLQFLKVVNLFYTFNGILQFIPAISTADPIASYLPVLFVVLMGMAKEGVLEYKRFQ